jgi:hypothetical protein
MSARTVLLALALALSWAAGAAVASPRYAVLSLVGDRLLVVSHGASVGSNIDRNRRAYVPVPGRALDDAMTASLASAVERASASTDVVMLAGSAELLAAEGEPAAEPDLRPVVERIRPALAKAGVTHLVVATKLRRPAAVELEGSTVGSGNLDGVGFYLDHSMRVDRFDETSDRSRGFLAPFAYFRVSLLDLARGAELAHRDVTASAATPGSRSPTLEVWEALSAEDKIRMVKTLMQREAAASVQALVGEAAPR